MKPNRWICLAASFILALSLTGCGGDGTAVYVQSVKDLAALGGIAPGDRFAGMVVSENVAKVEKDGERTIAELLVKEGDDVKEGDPLFSYDTEELQLTLDKQKLELEQLLASIDSYKQQIKDLERDRNQVGAGKKLEYTIQIQSTQVDLKEAELNLKTKENEVAQSEKILENATVTAPVTGRIQSISENGTDNRGNPLPYITIQQAGAYRVKGTIGELQRGGIVEGSRIRVLSRVDANQTWMGTVTLVDYENPSQGTENNYTGMAMDEMTMASKYPFYVELESTEGLLLGQHVYLELFTEEEAFSGISISSAFLCTGDDGSTYVWAEARGKLKKRPVTVESFNDMMGTCQITEGLSEDDFIAFPDPALCTEGAPTTHEMAEPEAVPESGG